MKPFFAALTMVLLAAPAFAAGPVSAELIVPIAKLPGPQALEKLDSMLYDFSVFELDTAAIERQVRTTGALQLYLGNQLFDLEVELNDMRAENYRAVVMVGGNEVEVNPPVATYKGHVVGDPASIVRLTVLPDRFEGYVKTDEEWVFIDPLTSYSPHSRPGDVVVYRDDDVRPEAAGECGAGQLHSLARELTAHTSPLASVTANATLRRLEVATDADGQHFQRYGNPGTFNQASSILNRVDGIYRAQLDLFISITFQQAWSNPSTDPYTSLSASTSLDQLRNWWEANRGSTNRDTVHKFSGKDFSGGTIGIAYVGVICNARNFSYGISEDQQNLALNGRLTAHEIGHNLSAGHDNQTPVCPGVNCNGSGPIMCSFIQTSGPDSFSSCSRSSIANHTAANPSCLN